MDKTHATTIATAPSRGGAARLNEARRTNASRKSAVSRARDARRGLHPRQERFAHLKRMYD